MNRQALSEYFERSIEAPLVLGELDCVRFVFEAIRAGWGKDYCDLLGYSDRRSAVDRLRLAGGLEDAMTAEFGEPVPAIDLDVGDIAFFEDPSIGLIMPSYVAVKIGRSIGRVPRHLFAKGWKTWVQF